MNKTDLHLWIKDTDVKLLNLGDMWQRRLANSKNKLKQKIEIGT